MYLSPKVALIAVKPFLTVFLTAVTVVLFAVVVAPLLVALVYTIVGFRVLSDFVSGKF